MRSRVLHNPEHCNYQMAFIKINAATMTLFVRVYLFPTISIVFCVSNGRLFHTTMRSIYINTLASRILMQVIFTKRTFCYSNRSYFVTTDTVAIGNSCVYWILTILYIMKCVCVWRKPFASSVPRSAISTITQMYHIQLRTQYIWHSVARSVIQY